jgi:hypothetical protein
VFIHRFGVALNAHLPDLATFNAMGAQGWIREGVVMCAPH